MKKIEWKQFRSSVYYASPSGQIRNSKSGEILEQSNAHGYMQVHIKLGGSWQFWRVHRIIAECFIENPEHKGEVDHIDGNRANNDIANLRWCTHKENCNNYVTRFRMELAQYNRVHSKDYVRPVFVRKPIEFYKTCVVLF